MPIKSQNRSSQLDEVGDIDAPHGSRPWCIAVMRHARSLLSRTESEAKDAADWIDMLAKSEAWRVLGFISFDAFLISELKIGEDFVDLLKTAFSGQTVGDIRKKCDDAKANPLAASDQTEAPRNPNGRNQHSEPDRSDRNTNRPTQDQTYTIRRLARDHVDLLARVRAGELSANAAAIEAGFRPKTATFNVEDLDKALTAWLRHFDVSDVIAAAKGRRDG
ncbi:MAG TPA: hypothetical protein EYG03_19975 [Planctomycetes bacterium]|nr:hypothetical protein [Planctomycetota bacterium]